MKYLKIYENFNLEKELNEYFFHDNGISYLYHFTLTDNIESIMSEGLIPRKNPNSYYPNGCQGIFLTTKNDTYSANLPGILINILEDFYADYYDDDGELIDDMPIDDNSPITLMKIRVDNLDYSKFRPDDDYKNNKYGWNKAKTKEEEIIESLDKWFAVCYLGEIPVENIVEHFPLL